MGDLTTHPECQALLRAILTDPADDLPRLLYADRLEENGDGARAEFIRVQVELAKCDDREPHCNRYVDRQYCSCAECVRYRANASRTYRLRRRERFAWWDIKDKAVAPFVSSDWTGLSTRQDKPETTVHLKVGGGILMVPRRGLVERIELTTADFLAHAADLFAAQPITEVRLTDRHPAEESTGWGRWHGNDGENLRWASRLPMAVFDRLTGEHLRYDYRPDFDPNVYYPSADAAHAALSRACVAYGRELAGLPPLSEETKR